VAAIFAAGAVQSRDAEALGAGPGGAVPDGIGRTLTVTDRRPLAPEKLA
jgi:hypothetical protein